MPDTEVVVFLGSSWPLLRDRTSRWREVCARLAARVIRLTVVDFVRFTPSALRPVAEPVESWLAGVDAVQVTVPLHRRVSTPFEAVAWSAAARRLDRTLGGARDRRVVLCANPLAVPLALRLPAAHRGFDAYDDWRALPLLARSRGRIVGGYRAAARFDGVTVGSPRLASVLAHDFGVTGTVVRNGVDTAAFGKPASAPDGLPAGPFAVYVGTVQSRVDLGLLATTVDVAPVVVAGSIAAEDRRMLELAGVRCLGHVPRDRLPGLLARAGVGLVPHRRDPLTDSMDPLKLLEYRAAGIPVVATDVPGTDLDGVTVVRRREEWSTAVARALAGGRVPAGALRDWQTVTDELVAAHRIAVGEPVATS